MYAGTAMHRRWYELTCHGDKNKTEGSFQWLLCSRYQVEILKRPLLPLRHCITIVQPEIQHLHHIATALLEHFSQVHDVLDLLRGHTVVLVKFSCFGDMRLLFLVLCEREYMGLDNVS
jgi:hypothetical protein